jgi:hypothetical protein
VKAAGRYGTATADDLFSGAAWDAMLDGLRRAGPLIADEATGPAERAAGYRHLLVLLALGIDEALRSSDPYEPRIGPGSVDAVLKWGMDCPDAAYLGAPVRPDATYTVRGRRGTVRYLGFQVMGGMATFANVVADDLDIGADGTFELVLSAERRAGNWMPLAEGASSLVVRQFFYDWEREGPAQLTIECTHDPVLVSRSPQPEELARQLVALGDFVDQSVRFWLDIEHGGRASGTNAFRTPSARTDMGGAEENISVWGSWELADDEALLIEVVPPPALYWSVSLGNFWWETLDYANHQTSLNGHQAVLDDDGVFRAIVAHRDPGIANWLDTTGQHSGPMPATRVIPFDAVANTLPAGTITMGDAARARVIAGRRAGVRRRFAR